MRASVNILKIVGTCGLGLLAGLYTGQSLLTMPTVLANETSSGASRAFARMLRRSQRLFGALSSATLATFAAAYLASPSEYRHPYLLYAALSVPLTAVYTTLVMQPLSHNVVTECNGEELRVDAQKWSRRNYARMGIASFTFLLTVIGIHGDMA